MPSHPGTRSTPWRHSALVLAAALVLYLVTLAPGVLWADSGHLQLGAVVGRVQGSAGSHPLWVWIAHAFTRLPIGDPAGRVNAVSALMAAVTVAVVHRTLLECGIGRGAAALAAAALAVAHTFWWHAVVAEVYALTLALMAVTIWLALRWQRTGRRAYLVLTALTLGAGLLAHLLVVVYVPAVLWLVWRRRRALRASDVWASIGAGVLGAAPLVALVWRDAAAMGLNAGEALRWALFTFEGYDFGPAMVAFSWRQLPSDAMEWLAFLVLQYLGPALLAGLLGAVTIWRRAGRDVATFVLLLYLGAVAFAFAYRVGDRYVFYLPSYLPFALWVGFGFEWGAEALARRLGGRPCPAWVVGAALLLVVAVPVATYRLAPELVARGVTFRDTRHVPGPRGRLYFLWPPKCGYDDAETFAREALASVPPDGLLLADPVLAAPLVYVQRVEGRRPDVVIRYCCWDLAEVLEQGGERPIALADTAPEVYPAQVLADYVLVPRGSVHLVVRR